MMIKALMANGFPMMWSIKLGQRSSEGMRLGAYDNLDNHSDGASGSL
jgi:hypothetical protein